MSKSSKNKVFCGFRVFEYVLWQQTKSQKCWKSTESFLNQKKQPVLTFYHYQKTGKKQSLCNLSTILALITKKLLQVSMVSLLDNFEQHFESCVQIMQNAQKSASNQINSLITSKNEHIHFFSWFLGFQMCSMAKNESLEMLEISRKHSK